jgi:hypothetical protein
MDEAKTMYGPKKLGRAKWEEQQGTMKARNREGTVYGKRKVPPTKAATAVPPGAPPRVNGDEKNPFLNDQGGRVSVAKLEELISEDPTLLDLALETELSHPDKPRKGAIDTLRRLEGTRGSGPRGSVMKLLEQLEKRG